MQETLIQYKYILLQEVYSRVSNVYEPNDELFVDSFINRWSDWKWKVKIWKKSLIGQKKEETQALDWSDDCSAPMWLRERSVSLFQRVFTQM